VRLENKLKFNDPSFLGPKKLMNHLAARIIAEPHPQQNKAPPKRNRERITNMQSFGSGNVDCGNLTNCYNNTITLSETITVNKTEDEDNQIKQWLSPLGPRYRHKSVQINRVEGVGDWLLETNGFREWRGKKGTPKQAVLFYYGHLGVGKTNFRSVGELSLSSVNR